MERSRQVPVLRSRPRWAGGLVVALAVLGGPGGPGGGPPPATAAPPAAVRVAVVGSAADGRLEDARRGAMLAARLPGLPAGEDEGVEARVFDDAGTEAGLATALKSAKAWPADVLLALPAGALAEAYAEALRGVKAPTFVLAPLPIDATRAGAATFHLAPSIATQAVAACDLLRAPLGAAGVLIVRADGAHGAAWEAALRRSLPASTRDLGTHVDTGDAAWPDAFAKAREGWLVVTLEGAALTRFVRAAEAAPAPPRCLYMDLTRADALRAAAPRAFETSLALGGPDPEGEGRAGEALLNLLDAAAEGSSETVVRAAEAARRGLAAVRTAGSRQPRKVLDALAPLTPAQGLLGNLAFEPPGSVRFFPLRPWRVRKGRWEEVPPGQLPAADCGPPLGFGVVRGQVRPERGRIGWLTYGEKPTRTIEADLKVLGLTTGGYDPELDGLILDEILGRAIRIAYRLFRREADGTPIRGWSWGMALTTEKPASLSPGETWVATLAGDHPDAGGQVTGAGTVAVYTTFLQRTMYAKHALDPPLEAYDKPHLLGRHRWGEDALKDLRGEKIRCLIDGFASAIALTLAHEFGHLCGCGHDTEHPTSIMNVVAGAGASWADAVWIPAHQKNLTTTLGIEGVEK